MACEWVSRLTRSRCAGNSEIAIDSYVGAVYEKNTIIN